MRREAWMFGSVFVLLGLAVASFAFAQRPGARQGGNRQASPARPNIQPPPKGELPEDEKLMSLYRNFVKDAEKLAKDYEALGKTEEARDVYLEILKFFPNYKLARQKLEEFQEKEAVADKKTVDVLANKGWQETGIYAIAGKPLKLVATGSWTCKVNQEVGPDGLQVSEELKGLNLGSLVGVIVPPPTKDKDGKIKDAPKPSPFAIGAAKEMVAGVSGKLMLRIYDLQTGDNSGKLKVEVIGAFERK